VYLIYVLCSLFFAPLCTGLVSSVPKVCQKL
jgi:hypothetical protein